MWVGKFKIKHKEDWVSPKTEQYNVSVIGFPLNSFIKNKRNFHTSIIFLRGEEKDKKAFISSLKKEPEVKKLKIKGNQIIALLEGKKYTANFFNPELFFIKPVLIEKGLEYWEIASWERGSLINFYEQIEKFAKIDILKLKREFPSVFVQQSVSKLTERQRKIFEYAKENGYYKYPRRISLQDLARKLNTPRTTFQNHLRKAECKLLNVLLE
jgi:predicted DNA binding protein